MIAVRTEVAIQFATDTYSPSPGVNEAIQWLLDLGVPPLPIAPYHNPLKERYFNLNADKPKRKPEPKFSGKNPSFLTVRGRPILVDHKDYQSKMPEPDLLKRWFAHPQTGVAAISGWRDIAWVDIDAKQFRSVAQCQTVVETWIRQYGLGCTYIERTHRGGYHLAFRVAGAKAIGFRQFRFVDSAIEASGVSTSDLDLEKGLGEVISNYYPIVLAPTQGTAGRYCCLNRAAPMAVSSLEEIGVVPARLKQGEALRGSHSAQLEQWFRTEMTNPDSKQRNCYRRSPLLNKLIRQQLLQEIHRCHLVEPGGRSDFLVLVAREAFGWQNWLLQHQYPAPMPDAVTFIFQVGEQIGLDEDRIGRIARSCSNDVPINQSLPGIWFHKGDQGCFAKLAAAWG